MPVIWRSALHQFAEWKCGNTSNKGEKVWGCDSQESIAVVKHVKQLYDNLKKAMPGLMSYRFQNEIFSEFTNMNGKSVVDYSDEENTIIAKAIPIMEVTKIKEAFKSSFKGGNFQGGKQFTYSHCIVDLNPTLSDYNKPDEEHSEFKVANGQFPMSFTSDVNVNVDEYKTKKMVLTRIDKISGEKFDTFTMGSHKTDYDLITDTKRRKYKDSESIVDGAIDDHATVTLGNGGSYQKRYANNDLKNTDEFPDGYESGNDLYYANTDPSADADPRRVVKRKPQTGEQVEGKYDAKYFKNKHFFMDPFALTIAQWCYVYGMHRNDNGDVPTKEVEVADAQGRNPGDADYVRTTKVVFDEDAMKDNARNNLKKSRSEHAGSIGPDNFNQMQESYWRYVCVWGEKGEWEKWKSTPGIPQSRDSV